MAKVANNGTEAVAEVAEAATKVATKVATTAIVKSKSVTLECITKAGSWNVSFFWKTKKKKNLDDSEC